MNSLSFNVLLSRSMRSVALFGLLLSVCFVVVAAHKAPRFPKPARKMLWTEAELRKEHNCSESELFVAVLPTVPRSGNTLFREIYERATGARTYSVFREGGEHVGKNLWLSKGVRAQGQHRTSVNPCLKLVKTHYPFVPEPVSLILFCVRRVTIFMRGSLTYVLQKFLDDANGSISSANSVFARSSCQLWCDDRLSRAHTVVVCRRSASIVCALRASVGRPSFAVGLVRWHSHCLFVRRSATRTDRDDKAHFQPALGAETVCRPYRCRFCAANFIQRAVASGGLVRRWPLCCLAPEKCLGGGIS